MRVETVTIHHPELLVEAQVPEGTEEGWTGQGWVVGPFPSPDNRPPRAGKGSGLTEWRDYATRRELAVLDTATRDEIIAMVEVLDQAIAAAVDPDVDDTAPQGPNPDPEEGDS